MPVTTPEVLTDIERDNATDADTALESGYVVICWNDPVNLMEYVTHVFQAVFGWKVKDPAIPGPPLPSHRFAVHSV